MMTTPFVVRKARELDRSLGKAARRVASRADEEALHDMRVILRRLRTLLRLIRPIYGRFRADFVRAAFSEIQSRTGSLRDEEALEATLGALAIEDPAFAAWRMQRRTREKRLRSALICSLRKGTLSRARRLLAALVLLPPKPSRDTEVSRFARRMVTRAHKRVDRLRDVPTSDVERLHELRILYKELRYAAEVFVEVLPVDLSALIAPASKLQKRLGDIHDIDMALVAIARARRLPSDTRARVSGALAEVRARKTRKYLDDTVPTSEPDSAPDYSRGTAPASAVAVSEPLVGSFGRRIRQ